MAEHAKETYTVTAGKVHHITPSGARKTLRVGDEFRPTKRQVESGSLVNNARPTGEATGARVSGADIGLRALSWGSEAALKLALEEKVTEEEMAGVEPTGADGDYITADVRTALEAREDADEE